MDVASKIRSLFPAPDRVPPDVRLEIPLRQDAYLVNGELRRWTGPMQDVFSPLRVFSIRTLVAAKAGELNKHIINTIVRERKSNFLSTDFIL